MQVISAEKLSKGLSVIGLMSGTSMDGIDLAHVKISRDASGRDHLVFLDFHYKPYPPVLREELLRLAEGNSGGTRSISLVNSLLGQLYAELVAEYIEKQTAGNQQIDLIASHGQTLYHSLEPESYLGYRISSSLQLGEASYLAERFSCPVVSDFRVRDQAAGGLGAPLVPFVEQAFSRDEKANLVYLNIGGISNITYIAHDAAQVVAFDTGPGNMLLDQAIERLTNGLETYDPDGSYAAQGSYHAELLAEWMNEPYYKRQPPKNSGRENFGRETVDRMLEQSRALGLSIHDTLATLTRLTARVNAAAIQDFCPGQADKIVVSGGGSRNLQLLRDLREEAPAAEVVTGDEILGYPNDAKEAVAFAYLGYKTYLGETNSVPTATGAEHGVIMGKISQ